MKTWMIPWYIVAFLCGAVTGQIHNNRDYSKRLNALENKALRFAEGEPCAITDGRQWVRIYAPCEVDCSPDNYTLDKGMAIPGKPLPYDWPAKPMPL